MSDVVSRIYPTLRITGWQWSAAELPVRVHAVVSLSEQDAFLQGHKA